MHLAYLVCVCIAFEWKISVWRHTYSTSGAHDIIILRSRHNVDPNSPKSQDYVPQTPQFSRDLTNSSPPNMGFGR
jgi:hypothetical protein